MTKIGIISDLHLDFKEWDFKEEPGVHYINAGDICHSSVRRDQFLKRHPDVMTITGNHDYYGAYALPWKDSLYHKYKWEREGLIIRGATLWTKMNNEYEYWEYCRSLADDRAIPGMSYESYVWTHHSHKLWLFSGDADIIVMHHAPSHLSVSPQFTGDPANIFFANDLYEEIINLTKKPKLIIHGHMHSPSDYMIGETRVICHPRGYPGETPYYNHYEPRIIEL